MKQILSIFLLVFSLHVSASQPQYMKSDSIKVVRLLKKAQSLKQDTNFMLFFGRQLKGVPYVAKTLENNADERLVINLRQLDCTTFVENVLALSLCAKNHLTRFEDFCTFLRLIRYKNGDVGYPNRLHYFSAWIADNSRMGYVEEVNSPNPPFTALQKVNLNFMTTHVQFYPMLEKHTAWIAMIKEMEEEFSGHEYPYIPKAEIANTSIFRDAIHDGDILALLTNRAGLDTSHIGIAVWKKDGLHLLNASAIRYKVVEESMTLYQYMQRHPSQIGIRVLKVNQWESKR